MGQSESKDQDFKSYANAVLYRNSKRSTGTGKNRKEVNAAVVCLHPSTQPT
jgi:hypothetical protein